MSVDIHKIRLDGGTQSRAAINEATVAEYAEAMADPDTVFPPVTVYFDGKEYWLADGFHRVAAWSLIGRTDIPAEIRQGDRRRAILHSVAANSAHGLRRSNDDKRRAVLTLLEDAEWAAWSNREIARRCAVSESFVRSLRDPICAQNADSTVRTVERNGTTYQQNTTNIGAGSRADQERAVPQMTPQAIEQKAEASADRADAAPDIEPVKAGDQEPASTTPEEDPAIAKARRELAKLTPEALIDDVIGLRADLADASAQVKAVKAERDAIKAQLAELTSDDSGAVIRALQAKLKNAENAKWKATEEQGRLQKQIYALKKRVEELQNMGIAL